MTNRALTLAATAALILAPVLVVRMAVPSPVLALHGCQDNESVNSKAIITFLWSDSRIPAADRLNINAAYLNATFYGYGEQDCSATVTADWLLDSIQYTNPYIIQAGWAYNPVDGRYEWVYTPADNSGGSITFDRVDTGPVAGCSYTITIENRHNDPQHSGYWWYLSFASAFSGCVTQHQVWVPTSSGFAYGGHQGGTLAWQGFEDWDRGSDLDYPYVNYSDRVYRIALRSAASATHWLMAPLSTTDFWCSGTDCQDSDNPPWGFYLYTHTSTNDGFWYADNP